VRVREGSSQSAPPPATTFEQMDIDAILKALPHRYPFLMIDRIIEIDSDNSAIGIKNISINEPIFQGHFPGNPVFPGVLIIEGMAQTAGATVIAHEGLDNGKKIVLLITIDKAKFRKPVLPGDVVEYHMTKKARRKMMWWYRGEAKVNGVLVAEAEVGAMIANA